MIEFLLVVGPLLLTAMGGIEISHLMFIRQAINVALMEAGRAGSTLNAHPAYIATAFEHALEPLYPPTRTETSEQRVRKAMARHRENYREQPWHIQLITPHSTAFADFSTSDQTVKHASGFTTIDNSYQLEHHQAHISKGWSEGMGPISGQTIFEANTLSLRLTWQYQPLLPGLGMIIGNTLSLEEDVILTMQSHPVLWPDDPLGRVTRQAYRHMTLDTLEAQPTPARLTPLSPTSQHTLPVESVTDRNTGINDTPHGALDNAEHPLEHNGSIPGPEYPADQTGRYQGETDAAVSGDNICTNTSPPLTIPNSERARSSIASVPDLRS